MEKEIIKKAYLYLVKTPVSNDITVCASESRLYPGTYVISPTKYGLDMGVVIGNLDDQQENSYTPGCQCVTGACNFGPSTKSDDSDLAAFGQPEGMGDLPVFEFKNVRELEKETDEEVSHEWNSAFKEPKLVEVDGDIPWISHIATPQELNKYNANTEAEKDAVRICKEKIVKQKLDMKLVAAHFLLCEQKVLFFFTAEERVDFRELVKDLVSVFKMRIELRQIGVRDESRVLGGLSVCGRDFCCHCVSDKLDPVTIKMAKEQNLTLNSMKISGPCGRLLCCLSFENDFYVEEKQTYPAEGTKLKVGNEFVRVTEINILRKKITVTGEEGQAFSIPREEVYYSGKNDRWEVSRSFQEQFCSN